MNDALKGTKMPPRGWTVLTTVLFASSGWVNVMLWVVTGRQFGFTATCAAIRGDELSGRDEESAGWNSADTPDVRDPDDDCDLYLGSTASGQGVICLEKGSTIGSYSSLPTASLPHPRPTSIFETHYKVLPSPPPARLANLW